MLIRLLIIVVCSIDWLKMFIVGVLFLCVGVGVVCGGLEIVWWIYSISSVGSVLIVNSMCYVYLDGSYVNMIMYSSIVVF